MSSTNTHHWSQRMPPEDTAALAGYSSSDKIVPSADAPVLMVIDIVESFVGANVPILEAQKTSRKACGERAWEALPAVAALMGEFRARNLPIVFTRADPLQSQIGPATRRQSSVAMAVKTGTATTLCLVQKSIGIVILAG